MMHDLIENLMYFKSMTNILRMKGAREDYT